MIKFRSLGRKIVKETNCYHVNNSNLEEIVKNLQSLDSHLFTCAKHIGSWLIIWCTIPLHQTYGFLDDQMGYYTF